MNEQLNYQNGNEHVELEPNIYNFIKENTRWYLHLPEYLETGAKEDLEVIAGSHKFLNRLANGQNEVTLQLNVRAFEGAEELELVEHCEAPKGGANYIMKMCNGKEVNSVVWICDVALLVFGDLPDRFYVQRVK